MNPNDPEDLSKINPDDLPDGHPLKQILEASRDAKREFKKELEKNIDQRNEFLFDEINALRDFAKDEIEYLRAIHGIVESTDFVMDTLKHSPTSIRTRMMRMIGNAILHKASEMDRMARRGREIEDNLREAIRKGDINP